MKLPKTLYAKIADGGTGPDYVSADPNMMTLVEMGETVRVGVYQLLEEREAEGCISMKRVEKKRR